MFIEPNNRTGRLYLFYLSPGCSESCGNRERFDVLQPDDILGDSELGESPGYQVGIKHARSRSTAFAIMISKR